VTNEYNLWMNKEEYNTNSRPRISHFYLGAEMESQTKARALENSENLALKRIAGKTYLLMVGAIEPRKGHEQVLQAFETMWAKGIDVTLVVVGQLGWAENNAVEQLQVLQAKTDKIQWLNYVSDPMLKSLYEGCAGTLMASFGEGFGLPLIEAAHYGASLIARDLPISREVCGDHAWYFQAQSGTELASELQEWLKLYHRSSEPKSLGVEWQTWPQSTAQLIDSVVHNQWNDAGVER
jgi:glycosyltransferase involved in cell wall biosynthesis